MDIVFVNDLRVSAIIGIYDWERTQRQDVVLNLEMATDVRAAAKSDDIKDALDYKAVSKRVAEFVEGSEFQLVETLAEKICELILTEFKVPWIRLVLNKQGAVSLARDVGVIIERGVKSKGNG